MSDINFVEIPEDIIFLIVENSLINEHPIIAKKKLFVYQQISKGWRKVCLNFLKKKISTLKFQKDTYIDLIEHKLEVKNWTIEMWIKKEKTNQRSVSILNASEFGWKLEQFDLTGKVGLTRYNYYDHVFNYTMENNKWVHLALTQDQKGTHFYVNGKFIETIKDTSFKVPLGWIGGEGKRDYAFVGEILEFKVYLKTKSNQEIIKEMYDVYPKDKSLMFYMMFSDGEIVNFCDKEKLIHKNVKIMQSDLKDFGRESEKDESKEKKESKKEKETKKNNSLF